MPRHTLHQISPHVYWLTPDGSTDRPVLGAVVGARGTLLVDAGNSPDHAQAMLEALAQRGLPRPSFAMLTHWHWDHVFGTAALDLPTFAHEETRRIVTRMARLDWSDAALDARVAEGSEIAFCRDMIRAELPDRSGLTIRPPEIGFSGQFDLDLGDVTCQILHVGGDHAADSSIAVVAEDGVVFLGDCIYPSIYHGPRHYTLAAVEPLFARLLGCAAEHYLPSHHTEPLTRAQLREEAELLITVGRIGAAHGPDRAAVLAALPAALGTAPTDDHIEVADEFLAGATDHP